MFRDHSLQIKISLSNANAASASALTAVKLYLSQQKSQSVAGVIDSVHVRSIIYVYARGWHQCALNELLTTVIFVVNWNSIVTWAVLKTY